MASNYRATNRITSLDELYQQRVIMHNGKVQVSGWFGSWQIRYAYNQIKAGLVFRVELIDPDQCKHKNYSVQNVITDGAGIVEQTEICVMCKKQRTWAYGETGEWR